MEYSAPQIAGRDEPFRSAIREHLKGHTQGLEDLAIEMLARGLSVRDIEDAFKLWEDYPHRMRNLAAKVPEDVWPDFKARVQAAYQALSRAIARELAAGIVADYGREQERGVAYFMDDFEACIAHLRFPVTHRRAIRTTNLLERLFVEERRRLKIIPNALGERPVLKLMFGALIRAAERWRSVKVTEFERRQMAAVRKELDQEYETMVDLNAKPSKDAAQIRISSSNRTCPPY